MAKPSLFYVAERAKLQGMAKALLCSPSLSCRGESHTARQGYGISLPPKPVLSNFFYVFHTSFQLLLPEISVNAMTLSKL